MHGSRCLLVETQALVTQGTIGQARRRSSGLDGNRFTVLTAVLEQHANLKLADQDIYVSTVGGLKLTEPAVDLALCMAMIGAYNNEVVQAGVCAIGEVGLGGELRTVPQIEQRVAQARRRGYEKILVPITQVEVAGQNALGVASIADLNEIFEKLGCNPTPQTRLSDGEKNGIIKCA
jgi:DNA repair protein RadA/Sms